jgi:hypothetical protein
VLDDSAISVRQLVDKTCSDCGIVGDDTASNHVFYLIPGERALGYILRFVLSRVLADLELVGDKNRKCLATHPLGWERWPSRERPPARRPVSSASLLRASSSGSASYLSGRVPAETPKTGRNREAILFSKVKSIVLNERNLVFRRRCRYPEIHQGARSRLHVIASTGWEYTIRQETLRIVRSSGLGSGGGVIPIDQLLSIANDDRWGRSKM